MSFSTLLNSAKSIIQTVDIIDALDIVIVALIIYGLLIFLKKTRGVQLLKGVGVFVFIYLFSTQLQLKTLSFLITNLMQFGFFVLIVVFQPELRRALEQVSNTNLASLNIFKKKTMEQEEVDKLQKAIVAICDSVKMMSEKRTGALIVMEKFSNLSEIKRSGTVLNSDINLEVICSIFYNGTPLHDGAVVVSNSRIDSAGCVLPLSDNFEISKEMGTRHRAALGLSEVTDAIVIVVSEETGRIGVAQNSVIRRNFTRQSLYDLLNKEFIEPIMTSGDKPSISKKRRK